MKKYVVTSCYEAGGLTGGRSTPYVTEAKSPIEAIRQLCPSFVRYNPKKHVNVLPYRCAEFYGYEVTEQGHRKMKRGRLFSYVQSKEEQPG